MIVKIHYLLKTINNTSRNDDYLLKTILLKKIIVFEAKTAMIETETCNCIPIGYHYFCNLSCLDEQEN